MANKIALTAAALALLAFASAPLTARQAAATASGTFTVAGKAAKISHVYASSGPGFFDKAKIDTTVVLSDVELTPAQLADSFGLVELANAGKVHAIVLVIDADKQIISCQMHDQAFRMSASVAGSNNKFDATTFTKTRIAGKAYTAKPDTFGPRDVPFEFSVTFDAPVRPK
ncbi:MAG TPA: hypothetical protein VJN96_19145 [Vicinamibacterales bacterium]|nr:hypothetical protein [Vicinamibacterales bacterium]